MIVGVFSGSGHPYIRCLVNIPRLGFRRHLLFLVDTGADSTYVHLADDIASEIPFELLTSRSDTRGVGGKSSYFLEPAIISFSDGVLTRTYEIEIRIAEPSADTALLPSLLGRNILNHWQMNYDPTNATLQFTVRHADRTIRRNV